MKKLTKNEFINRANKIHKNKYDYSKVYYVNTHTKILIVCPFHGDFKQTPNSHLLGSGCISCCGKKQLTNAEFIKKAKSIHGDIYDYSEAMYINNKHKIKIICPIHKDFIQTANCHLSGKGCPECKGGVRSSTFKFINKSKGIYGNLYDYSKVNYVNNHTKVIIKCKKHGEFKQRPQGHLSNRGCRLCGIEKRMKSRVSMLEFEFLNYLNISERSKYINGFCVDGYDEKNNIIYEFLGDYWHGNPETHDHTKINEVVYPKKTYKELYDYTFKRFDDLKKHGYTIKYIWENDWNKFKKGIDKVPKIQTH